MHRGVGRGGGKVEMGGWRDYMNFKGKLLKNRSVGAMSVKRLKFCLLQGVRCS